MEKTKQLVSMIVGIIVVIIIVLALVWLSNSTKTGNWLKSQVSPQAGVGELSPEETAQVLKKLNQPVVDASGKAVVTPKPEETAKILEQMSKTNTAQTAKQPSPEETAKILEQMSKSTK